MANIADIRLRSVRRDNERPGVALPPLERRIVADLCAELFTSLPRSDQRRKGREYLSGLLMADGRKSMRNIAAVVGGRAAEQSLHHFISNSTWSWHAVRRALGEYVVRSTPPQAWVIRPMVIPKSGEHSVGVDRCFVPAKGTIESAQRAVGVWAVSDESSVPVNWRLHLPPGWVGDFPRRHRASVPDKAREETLGDCLVEAYLEVADQYRLPARPVVLDARGNDIRAVVARLRSAGVPMLVRISGTEELTVADPALHGHHATTQPARQIIKATKGTRQGVMVPGPHDAMRMRLVSSARVHLPWRAGRARGAMRLLGVGRSDVWPAEFWLTNMTEAAPPVLLRLAALLERVEQDFGIATSVGIRDFAGRSYEGWHRHVTLASAAHAVVALTGVTRTRMSDASLAPKDPSGHLRRETSSFQAARTSSARSVVRSPVVASAPRAATRRSRDAHAFSYSDRTNRPLPNSSTCPRPQIRWKIPARSSSARSSHVSPAWPEIDCAMASSSSGP